ncbi:hypothetical protein NLJ89_g10841 [Agrocybe chaxingu]|uniref:Uncharacterized protein n=1 Tax=Agrocybe chaxingu TaxID=84603 RepID=A0A9W8MRR0_9AGAR|nr:hypothetical protein NLJ89_g10841 [Agrocybe chaxingu]
MVNPGAFQGARKAFLLCEKSEYAAAVVGGYALDQVALIQHRFFKRFPIDWDDSQEPTEEELAAVVDDAPDPEPELPDREKLGEEKYEQEMAKVSERQKRIEFKKAQIKRWLAYQFMKDSDLDPNDSGANNPYRAILHKLTSKGLQCPRLRTAANTWRKTQRIEIERKAKARAGSLTKGKMLALKDKIAKEEFGKLPKAEQDPPSTAPEDRQRCIQGLIKFIEPILDIVCEATGWKASFFAGGPEPAFEGRLNMVSVHSGTTTGDVKLTFGRAERTFYKETIVPALTSVVREHCLRVKDIQLSRKMTSILLVQPWTPLISLARRRNNRLLSPYPLL